MTCSFAVELRGFEPLTPSMPWTFAQVRRRSAGFAERRWGPHPGAGQARSRCRAILTALMSALARLVTAGFADNLRTKPKAWILKIWIQASDLLLPGSGDRI